MSTKATNGLVVDKSCQTGVRGWTPNRIYWHNHPGEISTQGETRLCVVCTNCNDWICTCEQPYTDKISLDPNYIPREYKNHPQVIWARMRLKQIREGDVVDVEYFDFEQKAIVRYRIRIVEISYSSAPGDDGFANVNHWHYELLEA